MKKYRFGVYISMQFVLTAHTTRQLKQRNVLGFFVVLDRNKYCKNRSLNYSMIGRNCLQVFTTDSLPDKDMSRWKRF